MSIDDHMASQGFIEGKGGGAGIPLPPSNFPNLEIMKLSMVSILAIYMLLNICIIKMDQKQSDWYIN